MTKRDTPEYEAKCRNSGICCHIPIVYKGQQIVVEGMHCKFLKKFDDTHFTCSTYKDRFEKAPWCHHSTQALKKEMLHVGCLYNTTGKGKVRLSKEEYDKEWPDIMKVILSQNHPPAIGRETYLNELKRRCPDKEWECKDYHTGILFYEKANPPSAVFTYRYSLDRD